MRLLLARLMCLWCMRWSWVCKGPSEILTVCSNEGAMMAWEREDRQAEGIGGIPAIIASRERLTVRRLVLLPLLIMVADTSSLGEPAGGALVGVREAGDRKLAGMCTLVFTVCVHCHLSWDGRCYTEKKNMSPQPSRKQHAEQSTAEAGDNSKKRCGASSITPNHTTKGHTDEAAQVAW